MGDTVETKDIQFYINPAGSDDWVEWQGIKSVDTEMSITSDPCDQKYFWADRSIEGTFEFKVPKFWRCKNRKRYKKLMMSLGVSRNYIDWLLVGAVCRKDIFGIDFSYQELWNEVLKAMYGI